jgi:copper transport protein
VRRACLAAALLALAAPAAALAHATLQRTEPSFRQRLEVAPRRVVLHFDQNVEPLPGSILVFDAKGHEYELPAASAANGPDLVARVRGLPRGPYTVRWKAFSGDGHVVAGVFTFGVRYDAPEPTQAYGSSGPTTAEHVARWLYFLGLALLVGGLGFRLLVLRGPLPPALERRFYRLWGLGVVGVLEVGVLAFLLRAEGALQLPFTRFLYGDLSPIAGGTRFGTAFIAMTLGYALVAALLFLAWLLERRAFLWAAFVLAAGFASGLSLSGHSAVDAGASKWSELADWVHLTAASLWAGGLVMLLAAKERRREAFVRFARFAPVLIAVLLGAGIYLSVLRLPAFSDLWAQGYGRILLVKIALVCVALAWGGFHHFLVTPLLDRPGVLGKLPRSLAGEGAVGMAVLLVAAVLVDSKPPPQGATARPASEAAARSPSSQVANTSSGSSSVSAEASWIASAARNP